jgi:hypothetical protein
MTSSALCVDECALKKRIGVGILRLAGLYRIPHRLPPAANSHTNSDKLVGP